MLNKTRTGLLIAFVLIIIVGAVGVSCTTKQEKKEGTPQGGEGEPVKLMSAGKHYPSESFRVEEYSVTEVVEKAKETGYWVRYGSAHGGPYTYYNKSESEKKLYGYVEGYISITVARDNYWFKLGPTNPEIPSDYEFTVMFAPQKNMTVDSASGAVKKQLKEVGIVLKGDEEIVWDLRKGFIPPKAF